MLGSVPEEELTMTEHALNQTVTAYLSIDGAAEAIEFYKRAFGATERYRIPGPDSKIGHAELFIGNVTVNPNFKPEDMGGQTPA